MFLIYLLVTAILQVSGYDADLCEPNVGIIHGHKIPIEDAPYVAGLTRKMPTPNHDFICGSCIIHERFLLTAAHCALRLNLTVLASMGSQRYRNTTSNTLIEVEKFLPHEKFNFGLHKNDICLVKLKKPIPFSKNIVKIGMPDKNFDVKPGTMVKITGWGLDEHNKKPLDLLQTTIPVLPSKCCHKVDINFDDKEICAGVKGRGPCYGDSGGPLVYQNMLIGLVSHSARKHPPYCGGGLDVYTKVNAYLDWINTTIANNL